MKTLRLRLLMFKVIGSEKVKSLCLIKHHASKTYEDVDV
jgi:hypothetical protein